nr:MAG TPA: hypothetical protein [Caudoviricetes sp.]
MQPPRRQRQYSLPLPPALHLSSRTGPRGRSTPFSEHQDPHYRLPFPLCSNRGRSWPEWPAAENPSRSRCPYKYRSSNHNQRMPCRVAPLKSSGFRLQDNAVQGGSLQCVLKNNAGNQLDFTCLDGAGGVHIRHITGYNTIACGRNTVETVQADAYCIDAGGTCSRCAGSRGADNIDRCGTVVILAHVKQGDAGESLYGLAKIVLYPLIVAGTARRSANLEKHVAVHHQHRDVAVHRVNQLIKLVNKSIAVAVQLGGIGEIDIGIELVGRSIQQLAQAIECVGDIPCARSRCHAVDYGIMECIAGCLDFFRSLECELIHRTGSVLQNTVNRERTAHDDSLRSLLDALGLICGIFTVDGAHSGGGGCFELDVAICQSRAAGSGRNGVIKHQFIQQQRAAAELVNNHLVNTVRHADLRFSKSNSHDFCLLYLSYFSCSAPARLVGLSSPGSPPRDPCVSTFAFAFTNALGSSDFAVSRNLSNPSRAPSLTSSFFAFSSAMNAFSAALDVNLTPLPVIAFAIASP